MFSGITNQFTSLVGAVKGQADEDVPAPSQDAAAANVNAAAVAAVDATSADAGAGGELAGEAGDEAAKRKPSLVDSFVIEATGWLGSAKGWLGNASIPSMPNMPSMPSMPAMPSMPSIPGMRKTAGEGEPGAEGADALTAAGGAVIGEEDDKSRYISATEGADSHPASGGGTPTGEDGQIGQGKGESVKITTKVTQQAKHFGSFLSSAISKAGTKIKETTHIPQTLLESFNKDQEAFAKGQGSADSGVAPWIGHPNEVKIKEEIMGLSQDRRNFVRAPPAGVDFEFNYESSYPTALAIMAEDKALETMRFELVPKIITEENFWRNYFYRVSLIIQAAELGTLGADGVGQASSGEDVKENQVDSQDKVSKDSQNLQDMNLHEKTDDSKQKQASNVEVIDTAPKSVGKLSESEFVSDKYQTTADTELAEIKDGLRRLGIDSMTKQVLNDNDEEQWEKDLEAELKDYEVVSSSSTTNIRSKKKKSNSKKKTSINGSSNSSVVGGGGVDQEVENEDEMPTISNLRTRNNNDWEEEYADLIEDTDDLK